MLTLSQEVSKQPALSVREGLAYFFTLENGTNFRLNRKEAFQTLFNQTHVQCFVCMTATPHWLDMWPGFSFRGQESGSVFGAAVCKIQARKCYIESLPSVSNGQRSCFSQSKSSTIQLPLTCDLFCQAVASFLAQFMNCSVCELRSEQ